MSDASKRYLRIIAINTGKIVLAISALTAAVKGYYDLQQQNQLILESVGSKVNALSEKVAFIEGRMTEMSRHVALSPTSVRVLSAPPLPPESKAETKVEVETSGKPMLKFKAYEAMPLKMEQLQQMQVQAQTP